MHLTESTILLTFLLVTDCLLVTGCKSFKAKKPNVSDSLLFQMLDDIYNATGVAVASGGSSDAINIMNHKYFNSCLEMLDPERVRLNKIASKPCKKQDKNQMVSIKPAGSGYVSIITHFYFCMGSGTDIGSKIHVNEGDEWCKDSQSNRFIMTVHGSYVRFAQAQTLLCITQPDSGEDVYMDICKDGDERQEWLLCHPKSYGKDGFLNCYPGNPDVKGK